MRKFTLLAAILMASFSFIAKADWYLRGPFNEYNPNGSEEWALTLTDTKNVFSGEFNIPAGDFNINLLNPDGNVFVPYNSKSFSAVNAVVEFTDNLFTGNSTLAWDDYEEVFMWKYPEWEGGKIKISIYATTNNPKIEIEYLGEGESSGISKMEREDSSIQVYSLKGVKVGEYSSGKDLETLAPGIYIVNGKKTVIR